ncbi:hypothetical protein SAMN04488023_1401 [Pedobacter rhizosphaerae]|uniref:Uncharacterized protein n=1 Tax=Pedobacter rhizosphaerae TaxID=390241 RepID=A0A1H9V9I0_9SPHI|nr:hypothetical protein SAMN04488023_1401 [Pedobacter rhizosphaerae]
MLSSETQRYVVIRRGAALNSTDRAGRLVLWSVFFVSKQSFFNPVRRVPQEFYGLFNGGESWTRFN